MVMAAQAMLIVGGLLAGVAVAAGRGVARAGIEPPPGGTGEDPTP